MRVLLIEDSIKLQRYISAGLRNAGYKVDVTGDGIDGLWRAESYDFDVIILDLMLPGMDGLTLLQRLRTHEKNVHVIILSAKDTVDDRVSGLSLGADDYLVKPFAFDELLARIQALIRRRYGIKHSVISIGDIQIDLGKKEISRSDQLIELTPREYALLEFLVLKRGTVVHRREIEEHIYDDHVEPSSNVVDATVCSLRKKIETANATMLIKTKRGQGYIIE
jgi:DNA-binding response OmpR family regulator